MDLHISSAFYLIHLCCLVFRYCRVEQFYKTSFCFIRLFNLLQVLILLVRLLELVWIMIILGFFQIFNFMWTIKSFVDDTEIDFLETLFYFDIPRSFKCPIIELAIMKMFFLPGSTLYLKFISWSLPDFHEETYWLPFF